MKNPIFALVTMVTVLLGSSLSAHAAGCAHLNSEQLGQANGILSSANRQGLFFYSERMGWISGVKFTRTERVENSEDGSQTLVVDLMLPGGMGARRVKDLSRIGVQQGSQAEPESLGRILGCF